MTSPLPPVFVNYFSAGLNHGIATLNLYALAHAEIGQSPIPLSAAALVFRAEDMKSTAAVVDDLLRKVGWSEPPPPPAAPSSAPAEPAASQPDSQTAPNIPGALKPLPPVFVSNISGSFVDGVVILSFFGMAEAEIGKPPVLIPVFTCALRARDAKGLADMMNDLFRQGQMMGSPAPTSSVQ